MPEVDSHTSEVRRRDGGVVLVPTRRATIKQLMARSHGWLPYTLGEWQLAESETHIFYLFLFFPITIRVIYPNSFK